MQVSTIIKLRFLQIDRLMTFEQTAIICILVVILSLFIFGKWRFDIVACLGLMATVFVGIVSPIEAFSGFGHPATITVALVLVISRAMAKSGATDGIRRLVSPEGSIFLQISTLSIMAAAMSMFINNVGALAILMPIAIDSAHKANRHPALILMPVSFASILGGLITMIGTPPNIIIANYRKQAVGESFQMFDFTPVGVCVAICGILFISLMGYKLIRIDKKQKSGEESLFEIESYISEVKITEESKLVGKTLVELDEELSEMDIVVVSMVRKNQRYTILPKRHELLQGDILLIEGGHDQIDKFLTKYKVSIVSAGGAKANILHSKETDTMEVVVMPNSRLEGKTVEQIRFKSNLSLNLLAVYRQGKPYRGRIKSFKIRVGDVLLLHGETDHLLDILSSIGCLPLAERDLTIGRRKFAWVALGVFITAIIATVSGYVPIYVSLTAAIVFLVIFNILPAKEIYDAIDWPVVVLLGAMLPVGKAVEATGVSELLVNWLLINTQGLNIVFILGLLLIVTMTLSDVLNNNATVILMAPIANSIALNTGHNPDAFLMAVAVGASCAFLTPIGHQNNALIMGPGGYKFSDYWKLGLPLEIIIILVAIPMIIFTWPL